jgi:hypothetical protein
MGYTFSKKGMQQAIDGKYLSYKCSNGCHSYCKGITTRGKEKGKICQCNCHGQNNRSVKT